MARRTVILTLAAIALAAAPATLAQTCNWETLQPGQWCQVPNTQMEDAARCDLPEYDCSSGVVNNACSKSVSYMMDAWSGGAYDSTRHNLVVAGGGHGDYCGNELYGFNVDSLTWAQLTRPTAAGNLGSGDSNYADGRPRSYHTYGSLAYFDNIDKFCIFDGRGGYPGVGSSGKIQCNDFSATSLASNSGLQGWQDVANVSAGGFPVAAAGSNYVYIDGADNKFYRWSGTGAPTVVSSSGTVPNCEAGAAVDEVNNRFMVLGDSCFFERNLTTGAFSTSLASPPSGCGSVGVGWTFDSSTGKFTAFCGGSSTHQYNRATNSWNTCSASSGSGPSNLGAGNGVFGRWQYVPHKNGYVLANRTDTNVYLYRLPTSCATGATAACGDGTDNDGDGQSDFPGDPGCASAADASERGTNECDDGTDNDGDGEQDFRPSCNPATMNCDSGCSGISDADESNCGDAECEGGETTTSCPSDCTSAPGGGTNMTPGAVQWDPATPYSVGYMIPLGDTDQDRDSRVGVEYRVQGSGTWKAAIDATLTQTETLGSSVDHCPDKTPAPCATMRAYSGAIWNLAPDTTYEVRFTFSDPEGYSEVRTSTTATAKEPRTNPTSPNYPCPGGTATDVCDTLAELRAAAAAATPGSVIRLAPGTYTAGASDSFAVQFTRDGTESNPILLRCLDRQTTILDGNGRNSTIEVSGADFLTIEDCTIQGGSHDGQQVWVRDNAAVTGFVMRRNVIHVPAVDVSGTRYGTGLNAKNHRFERFQILDNFFDGDVPPGVRDTTGVEGVLLHGQGHVVAHNTLRGVGDAIGTSRTQAPQNQGPNRHMLWFGNSIEWNEDDCLEPDYSWGPIIAHGNKCAGVHNSCLSAQPVFGGPVYFARNVCWAEGNQTFKLHSHNGNAPVGFYLFNNTVIIPWLCWSGEPWDFKMKNNLFVGVADGDDMVHAGCDFHGRYPSSGSTAEIDYNGWSYADNYRLDPCATTWPPTSCNYEAHSVILGSTVFANPQLVPAGSLPDPEIATNPVWDSNMYDIGDPRLHASSSAVNAGTPIPIVTDGFAGAAPDLGAFELGAPAPSYGIRGWSYGGSGGGDPPPTPTDLQVD